MAIARLPMLMLLPTAMLAGAPAAQAPAQQQAAQAASHSATVALTGGQQWVPTNIVVAQGDRLVLRARGMQINDNVTLNPDGMPPRYNRNDDLPLPEAPYTAVIGRIGGGSPFLVGSAYDGSAPASGMLELGLNVLMGEDWSGLMSETWSGGRRPMLFEATVEHVPQTPPAEPPGEATNTVDDPAVNLVESQGNSVAEANANTAAEAVPDEALPPAGYRGESAPNQSWLMPLLIGAGGMLALVLAGLLVKSLLRPRLEPAPPYEPGPATAPPPQVDIHPSLDRADGVVAGDEIGLAGPEIRLRAVLEPGATIFEGGEPAIEREERDD